MTVSHGKMGLRKIKTRKLEGTPMILKEGREYIVTFSRTNHSCRLTLAIKNPDEVKHHRHLLDIKNSNLNLKLNASDVQEGRFVIVFDAKSDTYFRGQLLTKPDKDNKVWIMSVDTGHVVRRGTDSLFYISREYLLEPFEAFECRLDGLEFFESTGIFRQALAAKKALFEGDLIATLVRHNKNVPVIKLTSGNGKVNLNTELVSEVYSLCPRPFPTKEENLKIAVSVSNYDTAPSPFVHIQFGDECFIYDMEFAIEQMQLEKLLSKAKPFKIEELTLTDIYLAPYENSLYRAKCVQTTNVGSSEEPMIEVQFIDYGNKSPVPLGKLRRAGLIDPHLERIPPLCHRVNLKWITSIVNVEAFGDVVDGKTFHIDDRKPLPDGTHVIALHEIKAGGKDTNVNKELVLKHICKGPKGK